jgi:sarcosine oxidase
MHDYIVIGTGGVGSAALFHLAKRGAKVLGLDRFPPGHDRGSSHGRTRIIRQAYYEHPDYVPLLFHAYELWADLGRRIGRPLLHEIGLLQAGPADSEVLAGVRRSALQHRLNVDELSAAELSQRFPGFQVPGDWHGLFEPRAGYLDVEACVVAHIEEARRYGAELRTGISVSGWRDVAGGIEVATDAGEFRARGLVVTAGPWAGQLLKELLVPLIVRRKCQYWYPAAAEYRAEQNCPAFLFDTPDGIFYGLPQVDGRGPEGDGLKVAEHTGGELVSDPLAVDRVFDAADNARVEAFLESYLPNVRRELLRHSVCMYTITPDEHFIVDRHPVDPRIVFAAGLSGHGFKFTCVLGEILAELAVDGRTNLPIGFLSLARLAGANIP